MKYGQSAMLAAVMLVAMVMVAIAGQVYFRETQTIPNTGSTTWTNTTKYASLQLTRIWIVNNKSATSTVTVNRVTSGSAYVYTNVVGTIACTGNKGSTATFTADRLLPGDKLTFANGVTTGATAIIEYEIQQP